MQWIWWQKFWATSPASPIQHAIMCQHKSPRELQPKVEGAAAEDVVHARGRRGGRGGHGGGRGSNAMFRDDGIINHYYLPHEWWNRMTDAQRDRARSLHKSG